MFCRECRVVAGQDRVFALFLLISSSSPSSSSSSLISVRRVRARANLLVPSPCEYHINALPIQHRYASWRRLQGSRLHRPRASSYTSAVTKPTPPATMTHPPIAAHAKPHRASRIGASGSHRSSSPCRVNTSHDLSLLSEPPNTANRLSSAAVMPDTHGRQIPPLPTSPARGRPLFGRL